MTAEMLPVTSGDFFLASLDQHMQRHSQGRHYGITVLELASKPDLESLSARWRRFHEEHPQAMHQIKRQFRPWGWRWQAVAAPEAPPPIAVRQVPRGQWEGLYQQRLQGRDNEAAITAPFTLEWLEDGASPGGVMVLTWQHTRLDGAGVNLLLECLGRDDWPDSCAALKPVAVKSWLANARLAAPLIKAFAKMHHQGCLSLWRRGVPLAGGPQFEVVPLSKEQTAAVHQRCRELCGDLVHMPFYAAVAARALALLHRLRGWSSPSIHVQLPAQPAQRPPGLIIGNHMRVLPLILAAEQMDTLPRAVVNVQKVYRQVLREKWTQAAESMMLVSQHLPVGALIPMIRLMSRGQICSLFHSHTGEVLPGQTEWCGAAVGNVVTIPSVSTPPGFGLFFSEHAGRLTPVLAWRDALLSADEQQQLRAQLLADLGLDV